MSERDRFGSRPLSLVEVDLDWVANPPGPVNPDGTPCYGTPATTQGTGLTFTIRTRRFASATAPRPWELDAIPCVSDVRFETARLKIGESLGSFGQVTITLADFADDDRLEDPFFTERPAAPVGTYFARLLARNPYWQGRALRLWTGSATDGFDPANGEWRHYQIRSLTRSNRSTWQLTAVSPLQLANLRNAKAPRALGWRLAYALPAGATTAIIEGHETADPSDGLCRLGDELCSFTRVGEVLTLGRGQFATQPEDHEAGDAVKLALHFQDASIPTILRTLLVDHGGIDPAFIPDADWQAESDRWLAQYRLSPLPISEPVGVVALVNELCEQAGLFLWYDERSRSLRLQAIRPVGIGSIRNLSDDDLIGEVELDPDPADRVSRVVLLYARRDVLGGMDNEAEFRRRLIGQGFGEGPQAYGEPALRTISSRWFTESDDALAARTAFTIAQQLQDGRVGIGFTVSKRHSDLDLGNVVKLVCRDLTDAAGKPKATLAIITGRSPSRDGVSVEFTAEPFP